MISIPKKILAQLKQDGVTRVGYGYERKQDSAREYIGRAATLGNFRVATHAMGDYMLGHMRPEGQQRCERKECPVVQSESVMPVIR